MSYRHIGRDGKSLVVYPALDKSASMVIEAYRHGTVIANEDAPRVALEILKAAGYDTKSEYVLVNAINTAVACLENHIENEEKAAKAAALDKRRAEVCKELGAAFVPAAADTALKRAIDRIIELENN